MPLGDYRLSRPPSGDGSISSDTAKLFRKLGSEATESPSVCYRADNAEKTEGRSSLPNDCS